MTTVLRPFNYTNRDFDSLLADLRRRMARSIPEWTTYDAGFESVLLELFAYVGDQHNFYIDRMGNEAYLQTAALRESILNLAQMFGYDPAPQTASSCTVQFSKVAGLSEDVTIPAGTQLFAQTEGQAPIFFELPTALLILTANATGTATVVEGRTESLENVGSSTGGERQSFVLRNPKVIRDSVRVFTKDGAINPADGLPTLVEWTNFSKLIDANFFDRAFTTYVDEDNFTYVFFGDGVSGVIPPVNTDIFVTYRYGAGTKGNVGVGSIRSFVSGGALTTKIASLTNTTAASGGTDPETIDSMRTSIPRSLTTIERAVSTADYAALALRVPGVVKASAAAAVSTAVTLYIAPAGGGAPTTNLQNAVTAYFDGPPSRKMIGTTVTPAAPTYVPINVTLSITVNPRYRRDIVAADVTTVVTALYSFDVRQFAELLMKAEVFKQVIDVPGVDYVDITVFSKTGSGTADVQLLVNEIASVGTIVVNATGGVLLS